MVRNQRKDSEASKTLSFSKVISVLKDAGFFIGAVTAVFGVISFILIELFEDPFREFFRREVLHAISEYDDEGVTRLATELNDRDLFQRQVLLALSDNDAEFVRNIREEFQTTNFLRELLNPPALNDLRIANRNLYDAVDAVCMFSTFFKIASLSQIKTGRLPSTWNEIWRKDSMRKIISASGFQRIWFPQIESLSGK